ncbi:GrpB family protein [Pseudomonas sp. BN414]|uniref:GrpB family protein n=1 Tax=Pseudomonas sp. BN414 TaxID=2567888 RepID=UPI0024574AC6|nr:GrpB family protein [Pseudomonas sp. BN414]
MVLRFSDLLRSDSGIRRRYQELKLRLEASYTSGIGEYLASKASFIESVMAHDKRPLDNEYAPQRAQISRLNQ